MEIKTYIANNSSLCIDFQHTRMHKSHILGETFHWNTTLSQQHMINDKNSV